MSQNQDIVPQLGALFRERRLEAGLSQVAAAKAAGIGRSTLIHFEQGSKDIRLTNLQALARVLGVSLGLQSPSPALVRRLQARAAEADRIAGRREAHLALAADLALGRRSALSALQQARRMVALWKREATCSPRYVDAWSRILRGDPAQVGGRLRDIDPAWLDALLQNTPFSQALVKP